MELFSSQNAPDVETLASDLQTLNLSQSRNAEEDPDGWNQSPSMAAEESESWGEEKAETFAYPTRPEEGDCTHFLRTGACRFGTNCKFNHPANKVKGKSKEGTELRMVAAKEKRDETVSENNGKIECKYYSTPAGCKYGNECRYLHQGNPGQVAELNFLGLPIRPGEKECTYYLRTGVCKYSSNCRYHHPDPTAVAQKDPQQPAVLPVPVPMTSWPRQGTISEYINAARPFGPAYYFPPHPNQQWNGYQAPVNAPYGTGMYMQHPPLAPIANDTNRKVNTQSSEYPERPGQPECVYFMKNGSCKFKAACRFHHPMSRLHKTPGTDLSSVGSQYRPDQQAICMNYNRYGSCKYGQSCRFRHPMESRSSSTNNLQEKNASNQESEW